MRSAAARIARANGLPTSLDQQRVRFVTRSVISLPHQHLPAERPKRKHVSTGLFRPRRKNQRTLPSRSARLVLSTPYPGMRQPTLAHSLRRSSCCYLSFWLVSEITIASDAQPWLPAREVTEGEKRGIYSTLESRHPRSRPESKDDFNRA